MSEGAPISYAPRGYCRCGYRTEPGVCAECGRNNRRVRRWDPGGRAARIRRWLIRSIVLAGLAGVFIWCGRYVLWNWWPVEQIEWLAAYGAQHAWARDYLRWPAEIVEYRWIRLRQLANREARRVWRSTPQLSGRNEFDGRYWAQELWGYGLALSGERFCEINELPSEDEPSLIRYGAVTKASLDEIVLRSNTIGSVRGSLAGTDRKR